VKKALERINGVDRIRSAGLHDPELQINFLPEQLETAGVTPGQLADTVAQNFRDLAAGNARVNDQSWLVRIVGRDSDPTYLSRLPVVGLSGEIPLGDLAEVVRAREEAGQAVMAAEEIVIRIDLDRGRSQVQVLTCDLSYDYVKINAEYRT